MKSNVIFRNVSVLSHKYNKNKWQVARNINTDFPIKQLDKTKQMLLKTLPREVDNVHNSSNTAWEAYIPFQRT